VSVLVSGRCHERLRFYLCCGPACLL